MVKFELNVTISRLLAFIIVALGFTLSYVLKEASPFVTSCTAAGVIIAIKTGFAAYGDSKKYSNGNGN